MYSWLQQIQSKGCSFVGSLQEAEEEAGEAGPERKNKRRLGGNGEVHDSGYHQELKGGNFTFSSLGPTVLSPGADCDEDSSEDEDEDVKVDAPKAKGECNPWTQKTPPVMSSSSEEEVEQRTDKKRGLERH